MRTALANNREPQPEPPYLAFHLQPGTGAGAIDASAGFEGDTAEVSPSKWRRVKGASWLAFQRSP